MCNLCSYQKRPKAYPGDPGDPVINFENPVIDELLPVKDPVF